MDLDQLKQILDLVREHDLAEFEVEQGGLRLKIRKDASGGYVPTHGAHVQTIPAAPPASAQPIPSPPNPVALPEVDIELAVVKSPIVGTFYRSSEPGTAPFVDVGDTVKKGQVLCIIEAMK